MVGEFGEVLVLDWGVAAELSIADRGLRPSTVRADLRILEGRIAAIRSSARRSTWRRSRRAATRRSISRADVFALGAMLAGIPRGVGAGAWRSRRRRSRHDAAQRYQSVPDLAADVNRYLAGRAVEAHREPFIDRISPRRPALPSADPARADLCRGARPADLPVPRLIVARRLGLVARRLPSGAIRGFSPSERRLKGSGGDG